MLFSGMSYRVCIFTGRNHVRLYTMHFKRKLNHFQKIFSTLLIFIPSPASPIREYKIKKNATHLFLSIDKHIDDIFKSKVHGSLYLRHL